MKCKIKTRSILRLLFTLIHGVMLWLDLFFTIVDELLVCTLTIYMISCVAVTECITHD